MRALGVIGGVGPVATALYYRQLVDAVVGATNGVQPELLLWSLPVDAVIEDKFIAKASLIEPAVEGRMRTMLDRALCSIAQNQIEAVAMPCNTLQPILDEMSRTWGVRNVNLIQATSERVRRFAVKTALVVASTATCRSDVYGVALERSGVNCHYLPSGDQALIGCQILHSLRADYTTSPVYQAFLERIAAAARGVDGVIIACTDLSGQVTERDIGVPVIDSLDALVDESVAYVLS